MFIVLNLLIHSAFSCSYSCESHYCLFFKGKIYCGVGEVEGSDRAGAFPLYHNSFEVITLLSFIFMLF